MIGNVFRKSIEIIFKELELTLKMPGDIDCYAMAIRGLWIQYDYYSDTGTSFLMLSIPEEYQMNTSNFIRINYFSWLKI